MSASELLRQDASAMAAAVRGNAVGAVALVRASLDRIEATDRRVNAFTAVLREYQASIALRKGKATANIVAIEAFDPAQH